jgi:hypothetical protein
MSISAVVFVVDDDDDDNILRKDLCMSTLNLSDAHRRHVSIVCVKLLNNNRVGTL